MENLSDAAAPFVRVFLFVYIPSHLRHFTFRKHVQLYQLPILLLAAITTTKAQQTGSVKESIKLISALQNIH